MPFKKIFSTLLQYFFQGVIIIAPIGITFWAVWSLFSVVDGLLPNIINTIFPSLIPKDLAGNFVKIPGLGFLLVIVLVLIVGRLSSLFAIEKLVTFLDMILEKTPGIKFIYSSVKDFLEAFAGNKKKFDKPVLVNVDSTDVWRIGFITKKNNKDFGLEEHLAVYVPHSYAISGITYLVPKQRVKPLLGISAAEAMKFTVSGGVTEVHD